MQLIVQSGSGAGQSFKLDKAQLVIGRQPGNEITIDDQQISRRHARLEVANGNVSIIDLGSVNGTLVNGVRLNPDAPQLLKSGDSIQIGSNILSLKADNAIDTITAIPVEQLRNQAANNSVPVANNLPTPPQAGTPAFNQPRPPLSPPGVNPAYPAMYAPPAPAAPPVPPATPPQHTAPPAPPYGVNNGYQQTGYPQAYGYQQPGYPVAGGYPPSAQPAPKKRNTGLFAGVAVVLIVGLVLASLIFFSNNSNRENVVPIFNPPSVPAVQTVAPVSPGVPTVVGGDSGTNPLPPTPPGIDNGEKLMLT